MSAEGFRALLERARQGDEAAAAELVRIYEPVLMRMIRVRLVDRRLKKVHGESDIFQSVMGSFFVRLALGQWEIEGPEDVMKLLTAMVRNKVADKARRKDVGRGGEPLDGPEAEAVPSPEATPSRIVEVRQLVARARERLSPELLQVVALRDEQMGWEEIAERVGGKPEALRKRLSRAVDEIARALGVDE